MFFFCCRTSHLNRCWNHQGAAQGAASTQPDDKNIKSNLPHTHRCVVERKTLSVGHTREPPVRFRSKSLQAASCDTLLGAFQLPSPPFALGMNQHLAQLLVRENVSAMATVLHGKLGPRTLTLSLSVVLVSGSLDDDPGAGRTHARGCAPWHPVPGG